MSTINWPDKIREFAKAIEHGDEIHKAWLHEAAEAFIAGRALPPARDGKTPIGDQEVLYIVDLSDHEDRYSFLVNQAVWDWINAPMTSLPADPLRELRADSSTYDPTTPPDLQEARKKEVIQEEGIAAEDLEECDYLCHVTIGSFDNDKALFAHGYPVFAYHGHKELQKWLESNPQYRLADESYEGQIY